MTPFIRVPSPSALQAALDAFLLDCEARRLSPATILIYRRRLEPFIAELAEADVQAVDQITPGHIRGFLVGMQSHYADTIQHQAARCIKTWLLWCQGEELISTTPMAKVKMPKLDHKVLPALTPEQVQAIIEECRCTRDHAIVLCLLDTGCRAGEFVALRVGDVDVADGRVTISHSAAKGKKARTVFLGVQSRRVLRRYLRERHNPKADAPLWLTDDGAALNQNALGHLLYRLGQRAGVEHCAPHAFRRTFCLWSHRAGADLEQLRRLMGHEDLSVIRQYLDLDANDLAKAHREHGPVDNML